MRNPMYSFVNGKKFILRILAQENSYSLKLCMSSSYGRGNDETEGENKMLGMVVNLKTVII